MIIRMITTDDAAALFTMMCRLDEETDYMMYEPGEREAKGYTIDRLEAALAPAVRGDVFLRAAVNDDGEIVGYIWAERGKLTRILHTAYIVVGLRAAYRGQGIGTEFFRLLDEWAKEKGIVRLELTVECANTEARKLYEKSGFKIEGVRPRSMLVCGKYADEYYMGKIFE